MADPRQAILDRLRAGRTQTDAPGLDFDVIARRRWPPRERMERLRQGMQAVHAEFLDAGPGDWPQAVQGFCRRERLETLLYAPASADGRTLAEAWAQGGPELVPYADPVECFKATLFERIDAGFTSSVAGVAETGALLLQPGPEEPRLLSLVPPVHLALLRASTIQDTLWAALAGRRWGFQGAHALMISGPSKTADIEQTLAYGVHGPKRLVVVLVDDLEG